MRTSILRAGSAIACVALTAACSTILGGDPPIPESAQEEQPQVHEAGLADSGHGADGSGEGGHDAVDGGSTADDAGGADAGDDGAEAAGDAAGDDVSDATTAGDDATDASSDGDAGDGCVRFMFGGGIGGGDTGIGPVDGGPCFPN